MPKLFGIVGLMLKHPSALQEFHLDLKAIKPIMRDPNVSSQEKRKTLNAMVDQLSEETFKIDVIASEIIRIINLKPEVCKEYDSTKSQVDALLLTLPRMKLHRKKLEDVVRGYRKQYGLKI